MRREMYKAARIMGDIKALSKGRIFQRLWNRGVGRFLNKIYRKVMK